MAVECPKCGKVVRCNTALAFHMRTHEETTRQDASEQSVTRHASNSPNSHYSKPFSMAQINREQAEAQEQELRRREAEVRLRKLEEREQSEQKAKQEQEWKETEKIIKEREKETEERLNQFSKAIGLKTQEEEKSKPSQVLSYEEKKFCGKCSKYILVSALSKCEDCEDRFCDDCLIECEDCEGSFCERCFDNHECIEEDSF